MCICFSFFRLSKTTSLCTVATSGVGQNSDKLLKTIQTPCQIMCDFWNESQSRTTVADLLQVHLIGCNIPVIILQKWLKDIIKHSYNTTAYKTFIQ